MAINIDGGASYATSVGVTLSITASNANEMYISNDLACSSGGTWEAYSTTKSWTLAQTNGTATVYVKFRDAAKNESLCISDTIIHDDVGPTSPALTIGTADFTLSVSHTLFLSAIDANEMYITNTPECGSGGIWENYATTRASWNLGSTNALTSVYVKFRDILGNESLCISDTITHDTIAPSVPTNVDDGINALTSSDSPTISWTASSDALSSIDYYEVSIGTSAGGTDVKSWTDVGDVTTTTFNDLSLTNSVTYYANVRAVDLLGNTSNHSSGDGFSLVYVSQIAMWENHTCATLSDGSAKCWGSNTRGELGAGDAIVRGDDPNEMGANLGFIDIDSTRTIKSIAPGEWHNCAILDNDTVKCWGSNSYGELGIGDADYRGDDPNEMGNNLAFADLAPGRTVKQLSAHEFRNCAILDNDTLKCWGDNIIGQLGLGDTDIRGDDPNEMGSNLPTVDLGTGRTAKQVSNGADYVCAILDNDTLKCWGGGDHGEPGHGDTLTRGDGANEMGDNLPIVDLGSGRTAKHISAGRRHMCVLLDNDTVKCWGESYYGESGHGDTLDRGDGANEMGDNLPIVDLGTGRTAKQIVAARYHVCVLLDNDLVKCWGRNDYGTLGYGDTIDRGDDANEMGDNLPYVDLGTGRTALQITGGYDGTCALLDNLLVKCWGRNTDGMLGLGDTADRGDDPNEMGDNLPYVNLLGN